MNKKRWMTYELLACNSLEFSAWLHHPHLTTEPPSMESELWIICPKEGKDSPEQFTFLANSSEVAGWDWVQSAECQHTWHSSLSPVASWMELKCTYPHISLSQHQGPLHLPPKRKGRQASKQTLSGGLSEKWILSSTDIFFSVSRNT